MDTFEYSPNEKTLFEGKTVKYHTLRELCVFTLEMYTFQYRASLTT